MYCVLDPDNITFPTNIFFFLSYTVHSSIAQIIHYHEYILDINKICIDVVSHYNRQDMHNNMTKQFLILNIIYSKCTNNK